MAPCAAVVPHAAEGETAALEADVAARERAACPRRTLDYPYRDSATPYPFFFIPAFNCCLFDIIELNGLQGGHGVREVLVAAVLVDVRTLNQHVRRLEALSEHYLKEFTIHPRFVRILAQTFWGSMSFFVRTTDQTSIGIIQGPVRGHSRPDTKVDNTIV
ncbi:hypothetical protein K435DRAFT_789514 [Dendrothele bispora CBS 962.96]|uniref:Uncharacterized protein n=1 Tax=Dendrothele bispora (strain CBS 962.96) TaxID=1314807 RepID=A0A4V4HIF3_DENBC|nr:hypothetical protein K435DRAFT_789514 [Dendrothele bispora CBS 962.96]